MTRNEQSVLLYGLRQQLHAIKAWIRSRGPNELYSEEFKSGWEEACESLLEDEDGNLISVLLKDEVLD